MQRHPTSRPATPARPTATAPTSFFQASLATRYVASIYWAFTTMTTVGYGDIVVTTTLERCFCVFGMLIGATVFGYIVGNVSVMMESFDLQSALRTQKMDRVKVSKGAVGSPRPTLSMLVATNERQCFALIRTRALSTEVPELLPDPSARI